MYAKFSIFILFFLVVLQQPSFTCEIELSKSFYQPGETISLDVIISNTTSAKECLKSLDITITDSLKLLCTLTSSYPVDTECIESGEEKTYTFSCVIPLHAVEGVGTVEVYVETWSGITRVQKEFFEIGVNYPPEITVISYPAVVNPSQQYEITFSVYDNFGIEDLVSAEVVLHHQMTQPSEREYYLFTWEKPDLYTVWKSNTFVGANASIQNREIVWTLTFLLSEIASPGEWTLEITVYDAAHQHHQVFERLYVTKYLSFHLQGTSRGFAASINFGKASPGEELPRVALILVVTSNSSVNVSIQGSDLYSPEGKILPMDIFYVESSVGSTVQLDGSRQVLYSMYAEKNGFNRETQIHIIFSGKLPEVVEAGTYSGIWYIMVEAV